MFTQPSTFSSCSGSRPRSACILNAIRPYAARFAGRALARLAAGDTLIEAVRYAHAAAALATTGFGVVAPLRRPETVRALPGVAA